MKAARRYVLAQHGPLARRAAPSAHPRVWASSLATTSSTLAPQTQIGKQTKAHNSSLAAGSVLNPNLVEPAIFAQKGAPSAPSSHSAGMLSVGVPFDSICLLCRSISFTYSAIPETHRHRGSQPGRSPDQNYPKASVSARQATQIYPTPDPGRGTFDWSCTVSADCLDRVIDNPLLALSDLCQTDTHTHISTPQRAQGLVPFWRCGDRKDDAYGLVLPNPTAIIDPQTSCAFPCVHD